MTPRLRLLLVALVLLGLARLWLRDSPAVDAVRPAAEVVQPAARASAVARKSSPESNAAQIAVASWPRTTMLADARDPFNPQEPVKRTARAEASDAAPARRGPRAPHAGRGASPAPTASPAVPPAAGIADAARPVASVHRPLQWRYIGYWIDDSGPRAVLSNGATTVLAGAGQMLDRTYRVESVTQVMLKLRDADSGQLFDVAYR